MFPEHSYRLCIWMFVVKWSNRIWTTNPRWFQIQVWSGQSFFFCVPDSKSQTKPSFFVVSQFPPFVVIFFELHLGSRLNNIYAVCLQLRIIRFICHSVLLIYFSLLHPVFLSWLSAYPPPCLQMHFHTCCSSFPQNVRRCHIYDIERKHQVCWTLL